ncbi:MAG: hypothetical protein M1837_007091 [Sclerophora amabilis]|nr:MAG: hypothetical protein M1837_007091 [Sclerophora amabilis]
MSFRKRSVPLPSRSTSTSTNTTDPRSPPTPTPPKTAPSAPTPAAPGTRPSPTDGRPIISTGTPSLDALLAGHSGLPLGTSLLVTESGTTDYAGVMCRYFGAEGVVQSAGQTAGGGGGVGGGGGEAAIAQKVHVVGPGEAWGRGLPGLVGVADAEGDAAKRGKGERMKIAWRYEGLGEAGVGMGGRGVRGTPSPGVDISAPSTASSIPPPAFCHAFDLTKRLSVPSPSPINCISPSPPDPRIAPFSHILQNLQHQLSSSARTTVHRLIIPNLLSPALYPPHASSPHHLLPFLHSIRGLLRQYSTQLAILITLPLELYPRSSGLVRWIELLSDGVIELTPFPHSADSTQQLATSGAATAQEEQPQGLVKIHRLPVFHERGGGGGGGLGLGDDLAFTVSRRKFAIKPFSLPPVEGDTEAQQKGAAGEGGTQTTAINVDF